MGSKTLIADGSDFGEQASDAKRINLEEEMQDRIFTHEDGPYVVAENGEIKFLAKLLTNAEPWQTVIYLDGDPLNNQRHNLLVIATEQLEDICNVPRTRSFRWSRNRSRRD